MIAMLGLPAVRGTVLDRLRHAGTLFPVPSTWSVFLGTGGTVVRTESVASRDGVPAGAFTNALDAVRSNSFFRKSHLSSWVTS